MNYVFFFPDEMRAESLSCYGNAHVNTPNYERLAADGVMFSQCHVQNPVCSPSRCTLFTGRYVHTDGHRTLWNLVKPWEQNLFGYLKEAGYEVRIYGKNDLFSPEAVEKFTDVFENRKSGIEQYPAPLKDFGQSGYFDFLYQPIPGEYTDHGDYRNLAAGMDFIRSRKPGDKPFILFLPLSFPHCPYTAHQPFYDMYDPETLPDLRPEGKNKPDFHRYIREYRDLKDTHFKKVQAVYLGMISFTDKLLGELLDCVEESGIKDETMVIASSDHGDYAGDYRLVEKWPNGFEDVLTRVPLIISGPGFKKGVVVEQQNELFDIMPTILETAGIPVRHTHFAKSLVPQLNGDPGDPDRAVYCEGGYNKNEPHCNEGTPLPSRDFMRSDRNPYYPKGLQQREQPESAGRGVMIRTATHKLILRTYGDNELYDLANDPDELCNIIDAPEANSVRDALESRMLRWFIQTSDCVPFVEDPRE